MQKIDLLGAPAIDGREMMTVRMFKTLTMLAVSTGFASAAVAQAPTWSADQTAAWGVVSQSWADEVAQNGKWPGAYAHENMVSWGEDFPIPRSKDSVTKWTRFEDTQGKVINYEISPVAIAVSGNTAVVNYYAVAMRQRGNDKPEREVTGLVETLVKDGNGWKFLASTSFDNEK